MTYHSHQTSPNSAPIDIHCATTPTRSGMTLDRVAPMKCAKSPILVAEGYARRPGALKPLMEVAVKLRDPALDVEVPQTLTRCKQRQRSTWAVGIVGLLVGSDGPMIISWKCGQIFGTQICIQLNRLSW